MYSMNSKKGLDEWLENPRRIVQAVTKELSSSPENPRIVIRIFGENNSGFKVEIKIDPKAVHKKTPPHQCKCFHFGTCVEGAGLTGRLVAEEEKGIRGAFYLSEKRDLPQKGEKESGKEFSVRAVVDGAIPKITYQYQKNLKDDSANPVTKKKFVQVPGVGFVNSKKRNAILRTIASRKAASSSDNPV